MSKIGVVGALVNFNLRTKSLAHCIQAAEAKAVIFSSELTEGLFSFIFSLMNHCFSMMMQVNLSCRLQFYQFYEWIVTQSVQIN